MTDNTFDGQLYTDIVYKNEEWNHILKLFRTKKLTQREIADEIGRSQSYVHSVLKQCGVTKDDIQEAHKYRVDCGASTRGGYGRAVSNYNRERVFEFIQKYGVMNKYEIADALGMHFNTAYKYLLEWEIKHANDNK